MTKHLHLIWLQGEHELEDASRTAVQMWRLLNPAWSVTVWDQQMLRDWIAANSPQYRDLWTWLRCSRKTQSAKISGSKAEEGIESTACMAHLAQKRAAQFSRARLSAHAQTDLNP